MAKVSNTSAPTSSSISVLVQLDQGADGAQYYTTITCSGGGQVFSSSNLGGLPHYNSTQKHWTKPHNFTGLKPNTTYTFTAYSTWGSIDSGFWSTTNPPAPQKPTDRVSFDHWSSTTSSITTRILNSYGATSVDWKAVNEYTSQYHYFNDRSVYSTPYYETLSGLDAGTQYTIGANGFNAGGYAGERTASFSTRPAIPSISKGTNNEKNKITIDVNPDGGFDLIEVEMWTIDAVSRLETKTQGWNKGGNFDATFGINSPLTPNASYLFRARTTKKSYSPTPSAWGGWLTVKNEASKPDNWKWTTAQNTNGHKISGAQFSLLAAEWNNFTARINEFLVYKGKNTFTFKIAERGKPFTNTMFNEARAEINKIRETGLSTVAKGQEIKAASLNTLMNTLNAVT